MDIFLNLRADKQEHIINAALNVFGENGYKKASVADIAERAGIAKGMINYYFGSKKNLYLYLAELCFKRMSAEMDSRITGVETDFFERMKKSVVIKVNLIKEYPAILLFAMSLYIENDAEIAKEIFEFKAKALEFRERLLFTAVDDYKFNDDVDPKLLDKFFVWAAEGFVSVLNKTPGVEEIDAMTNDFFEFFDLMKRYFYKDEHKEAGNYGDN